MKWVLRLVGLGSLALGIGGCSSGGLPGTVLLAPKTYGSGQGAFVVSFSRSPTTNVGYAVGRPDPTATTNPPPPPPLGSRTTWFGGDVDVSVNAQQGVLAPDRIEAQLRSYLPVATGGRLYLFEGMPAIEEAIDCVVPSGPCPGKTAGLEVLDGSMLFSVFVSGLDEAGTEQALASFHPLSVVTTAGCSYQVSRTGFSERCVQSG